MDKPEWSKIIKECKADFDSLETNKERIKRNLKDILARVIGKNTNCKFGIMFSGGVDSTLISLICKSLGLNFNCYTVGIEGAEDLIYAEKVANFLGLNLKKKILDLEQVEDALNNVVKILKTDDYTKVAVGCVTYLTLKFAKENGEDVLLNGLGSEELFAGYQRHEKVFAGSKFKELHDECFNGLISLYERDLERDIPIAKSLNMKIICPFLDNEVMKFAMKIHPMYKISKELNKIVLREIAEDYGLAKEFALRKKKACQYGSDVDKAIEILAKKKGFKFKGEYIKSLM